MIPYLLTSGSHPLYTQQRASTLRQGLSNSILWSSEGSGEVLSSTREALLCFKYWELYVKKKKRNFMIKQHMHFEKYYAEAM